MALEFLDLGLGSEHVDYQAAWDLQRAIHAEVSAAPDRTPYCSWSTPASTPRASGPSRRNGPSTARR